MPCVYYCNRPKVLKRPEVIGVFKGGCVGNTKAGKGEIAHAHTSGPCVDWICFLLPDALDNDMVCLHELAHVITKQAHTAKWREVLLELGGTLDEIDINLKEDKKNYFILRSYHKKKKRKKSNARK